MLCRQAFGQHVAALELPVRIVGREQDHVLGADMVEDALEPSLLRRFIHRLQGEAYMIAHDPCWRPVNPRRLGADAAPGLVEAPQESRQPGDSAFDEHYLERRKFDKHAL